MMSSPVFSQLPEGRSKEIVEAATGVFARYGFARVTMADLAKAVGISRTALYPLFANKAEVFDAVVRNHAAGFVIAVRSGLAAHASLETKLRFACEHLIVPGFEFVQAMPDARDLFDLDVPAVRDVYAAIHAVLVEIIEPYTDGRGVDVETLVRATTASLRSFKEIAADTADLRQLIGVQVSLIVSRLEQGIDRRGAVAKE
ncbi:TetR/AcrR family transcriptional regulator [Aureimonas psammosilenae]|uniref:TetR/AcrR family transcriptional regulator n=1 Tax=Aureimonas psammosilenae TaxID=2495496 RepID=UPI001869A6DF|nr:TetR/AcrR family transcriptional regulator [Aureimonas psammosilenae]